MSFPVQTKVTQSTDTLGMPPSQTSGSNSPFMTSTASMLVVGPSPIFPVFPGIGIFEISENENINLTQQFILVTLSQGDALV